MNTRFRYQYTRLRGEAPQRIVVVASGRLHPGARSRVLQSLRGNLFIPHQVGLPDLQGSPIDANDHPWHELLEVSDSTRPVNTTWAAGDLARTFSRTRWDARAAERTLGLDRAREEIRLANRRVDDDEHMIAFLMAEEDLGIW